MSWNAKGFWRGRTLARLKGLLKKTQVTVTTVHAPWNIGALFNISAAWDSGDCHPSFSAHIALHPLLRAKI